MTQFERSDWLRLASFINFIIEFLSDACLVCIWTQQPAANIVLFWKVCWSVNSSVDGPLTRYVKLIAGCACAGNAGNIFPAPTSKETVSSRTRLASWHVRHVMHVGIANPRWRGKRSRHSRRMRTPKFYESYKRPIWKITARRCDVTLNDHIDTKHQQ